jgi:hypothetical protein
MIVTKRNEGHNRGCGFMATESAVHIFAPSPFQATAAPHRNTCLITRQLREKKEEHAVNKSAIEPSHSNELQPDLYLCCTKPQPQNRTPDKKKTERER